MWKGEKFGSGIRPGIVLFRAEKTGPLIQTVRSSPPRHRGIQKETLRVSGFYVPARDRRHGGHHLRADYFHEVKVMPHPGGPPWPGSIILDAHSFIENRLDIPDPCADHNASAETCVKSHQRWNFTVCSARWGDANSDRNAHLHGRDKENRYFSSLFARFSMIGEWQWKNLCF